MPLPADANVAALLRRAQKHEPEAFDQLYTLFVDLAFRYTFLRSGDYISAESIVTATFVDLAGSIHTIRGLRGPHQARVVAAWLIQHIDRRIGSSDGSGTPVLELPDNGVQRELAPDSALAVTIMQLPLDQQQVAILRCIERLPISDVAAMIGRTLEATKMLQYQALAALALAQKYSPNASKAW